MVVFIICILLFGIWESKAEPCSTEDKATAIFFYESTSETLSCEEIVAKNYCLCLKGSVKDSCCASCGKHKDNLDGCTCFDDLGSENVINVQTANSDIILDVIDSCEKLVTKYTSWCETYGGNGKACCKSCRGVDLSCVDDVSKAFTKAGKQFNCTSWLNYDVCNCQDKTIKDVCCASCKGKDLRHCKCRDTVDEDDPANVKDPITGHVLDSFSSCMNLLQKYPQSCLDGEVYKNGGTCCESCKRIDRKCMDMVNDELPIELRNGNGEVILKLSTCEDLQHKTGGYPELCTVYGGKGNTCCETCQYVDTSCLDTKLTVWKQNDIVYNCSSFISLDKCNCDKAGYKCCKTCSIYKAKELAGCCDINKRWRAKGVIRNKKTACNKCSCKDIRKKGKSFSRFACRENVKNTRDNCCKMCRKVGIY